MSRRNDRAKTNVKTDETVVTNDVVFVRVIQNFNDATDNNNFVSAGKNTFYRTNKERADMLAKAGYVEYVDGTEVADTIVDDNTDEDNSDSNVDNNNVDNGTNDDTNNDTNEDENNSDDTNASDNVDDTNNNVGNNTDEENNPNE